MVSNVDVIICILSEGAIGEFGQQCVSSGASVFEVTKSTSGEHYRESVKYILSTFGTHPRNTRIYHVQSVGFSRSRASKYQTNPVFVNREMSYK